MKTTSLQLLIVLFLVLSKMNVQTQLIIYGSYNGKNIYVQNPIKVYNPTT